MSGSGSGFLRPGLQRKNSNASSAAGSTHSHGRRASIEHKLASLTRKLSFGSITSKQKNKSSDNLAHYLQEDDGTGGGGGGGGEGYGVGFPTASPRGSMSFEDCHDEHIVRSTPHDSKQQQQHLQDRRLSMATASSHQHQQYLHPSSASEHSHPHPHQDNARRNDSIPVSVHAPSLVDSNVSGSSARAHAPAATTTSAGLPQNPFKRQSPRILAFFAGTTLAVLVLGRIHSLLAILIATCAAYVLRVQLDRAGSDLLWEAEWRTIESKAKQNEEQGETALWINHCLRIVWPLLNSELFTPFVDLLEDSLMQEVQNLGIVHGCRVEDLDQGRTALQIKAFKILDDDPAAFVGHIAPPTNAAKQAAPIQDEPNGRADTGEYINIEVSFSYRGTKRRGAASSKANAGAGSDLAREVDAEDASVEARENIHMLLYMMIGLQKIAAVELPVWVSVLGIEGKIRMRLQILPNPPFVKTVAITFPSLPALELSARPLGRKMLIDAMQLPLVSTYILHSVENVIKGFISPRSYTVDVPALLGSADGPQHTYALGVVIVVLHEASHIPAADANGSSDPFVQISFSKAGRPLHRTRVWRRTRDPIWMEWTPLLISPDEVRDKEYIRLTVFDADRFSADDALGKVEISIDRLIKSYHKHAAEDDVSKMFDCREEALQPMTRGGRTSGTLKYSAAFFGLALGEGHSMSPHRQAMLKEATMRSFGATPSVDPSTELPEGESAFAAVKGGKPDQPQMQEEQKVDLTQFETPFDRFVRQLGLPSDEALLRQRYERKQRVQKLVEMIEGAEAAHVAPPQTDRPAGILVWHIHGLDSLEIPSTQRTLTSKRAQASKTKLSTAEDHSEAGSGSRKMPSSYVQVVLNDVAVFRTRTKPLNSQPFINSGSERWRDARQRESDAIIGVVGLRLVNVLKESGRMTDQWSLTGGVGYGKIRISLLFRSIDVTIPKALSGWNIGVLEVGACRVSGLDAGDFERRDCSLLFESGNSSIETEDASSSLQTGAEAGAKPTVDYMWTLDNPIKVAVRTRYPSNLFITLRSDRSLGRHITHAFAMLPLNRIPDNAEITRRIPLFHTHNLQTFEQETLRAMTASKQLATEGAAAASAAPTSRRAPILHELCEQAEQGVTPKDLAGASIRHVGWLQLTCVFNAGCGPEHRSLVSGDSELRMVYESLLALVDAGQRRPPVSMLSKSRRRKLSLDLLSQGPGTAVGADAAMGPDEPAETTPTAGMPGPSTPSRQHRRVVSVDQDGGGGSSPTGSQANWRYSMPGPSTPGGRSMRSGSDDYYGEDDTELFGEEAAHKRVLARTQRGPAQFRMVRTMNFLKQSGEDAIAKMKTKVSARGRTLSSVEGEGGIQGRADDGKEEEEEEDKKQKKADWRTHAILKPVKPVLDALEAWIRRCLPWRALKPILRSALLMELALIFLLIDPVERMMGQASFLILISALISPAELPLAMTIEREIFNVGLVLLGWAWACLGLKLAHLARDHPLPPSQVDYALLYHGEYLEAKSSAVMAAFLALGSAFFLYIKVALGPSPYLFGSIFGAILMTISTTTGVLFPYPLYSIGQAVAIPLAIKAGLAIFLSMVFFPDSVNSLYVERLLQLLSHVSAASRKQCEMFKQSPTDEDYDFAAVHNLVSAAEAAVAPLQGASRLLQRELSFGLLGADLETLQQAAIGLISPSDGWAFFFKMIEMDIKSQHFPGTPTPSRPASHASTPASTRPPSPEPGERPKSSTLTQVSAGSSDRIGVESGAEHSPESERPPRSPAGAAPSHASNDWAHRLSSSLLRSRRPASLHLGVGASNVRKRHRHKSSGPVPVATFESLRFAKVEAQMHTRAADKYTVAIHRLLGEANCELLTGCGDAMDEILALLKTINSTRLTLFRQWLLQAVGGSKPQLASTNAQGSAEKGDAEQEERSITSERIKLERLLDEFKHEKRHIVDKPFITASAHAGLPPSLKDEILSGSSSAGEEIPHRYFYQSLVHAFHTISFAERLIELLKLFEKLDVPHRRARFWLPSLPHVLDAKLFASAIGHADERGADEDETHVEGMTRAEDSVWCKTKRRDPDALEPTNVVQMLGKGLYDAVRMLFRGNILFAIKAGLLILLVSIPAYLKSSAYFFYSQRGIWVLIMCQLTLMRWRGETLFGLINRIVTTFFGCAVGLVIWYIGAGSGKGNPYALAVVWGVASIPIAAWRLQGPGPPIALIITSVSIGLVVGYSIKDARNPAPSSVGYGFDVGWRRLVGVCIGVTAAGVWSLLPPSRTIRGYTRSLSATTIAKLGEIYCVIMTSAASPGPVQLEDSDRNLMAVRAKLRRLAVVQAHAGYELGLRGPWPKEQYAQLNATQMEIAKLLSHLVLMIDRLHQLQKHAAMEQTRFLDAVFLSDCVSVFVMTSMALRSAMPLPQLTAAPLVHRFLLLESELARRKTWRAEHRVRKLDHEDTMGFPRHFCAELLEDEAFMTVSVAMTTGFGILLRLDRLMVSTKALVGEAYPVGAASYLLVPGEDDEDDEHHHHHAAPVPSHGGVVADVPRSGKSHRHEAAAAHHHHHQPPEDQQQRR
ncbi:hypothetical protein OC842_004699 [Tilletia horrida]|uniref:C2 domain-containing protein n=1 Tax=Tilletia horrida TaxID=155126 RepID=A0AAN6G984_9BASI|nr:hypothetical protein OC842_004699 [Tilletia horrida]